jgi:hypothetical protein
MTLIQFHAFYMQNPADSQSADPSYVTTSSTSTYGIVDSDIQIFFKLETAQMQGRGTKVQER